MVGGLEGVADGVGGGVGVGDGEGVRGELGDVVLDCLGDVAVGGFSPVPQARTFHLVEDRVVASVDGVAAVDVGADGVAGAFVRAEGVGLVGAGVRAQDGALVDVVGVGSAAAGVVGGEAEGVEVLSYGDDGEEAVVVFVGWGGEAGFDYLARDGDGVVGLKVQAAGDGGEDGRGDVGPLVGVVFAAIDLERIGIRGSWTTHQYRNASFREGLRTCGLGLTLRLHCRG